MFASIYYMNNTFQGANMHCILH